MTTDGVTAALGLALRRAAALLVLPLFLACGPGTEPAGADGTPEISSPADTGRWDGVDAFADVPAAVEVPEFQVAVYEWTSANDWEPGAGATAGRERSIAPPAGETLTVGPCTFVRPAPWDFCDPACTPPEQCGPGGHCVMPPGPLGAGDIAVTGLTVGLSLSPETRYMYYQAVFDPEPAAGDLFTEGAIIEATATGGDVPPFTVSVAGVAPMDTTLSCPPALDPEADLLVAWESAAEGGTIRFSMARAPPGPQFSSIRCEAGEVGALTVDRTLVAAWLEDWHPVQAWSLARTRRGTAALPEHRVTLIAETSVSCSW